MADSPLRSTLVDFFIGIGKNIADTVLGKFPNKLSEEDRAQLEAAVNEAAREHELKLLDMALEQEKLALEQDAEFNKRIKEMEGTASDLIQAGWLGKVILFFRGMQRPLWGYSVLVLDFMIFSGKWKLPEISVAAGDVVSGADVESAFWWINFLVLGFLFGERATKNVMSQLKSKSSDQ